MSEQYLDLFALNFFGGILFLVTNLHILFALEACLSELYLSHSDKLRNNACRFSFRIHYGLTSTRIFDYLHHIGRYRLLFLACILNRLYRNREIRKALKEIIPASAAAIMTIFFITVLINCLFIIKFTPPKSQSQVYFVSAG